MSGKFIQFAVDNFTWSALCPNVFDVFTLNSPVLPEHPKAFLRFRGLFLDILFWWQRDVRPGNWYPRRTKLSEHLNIPQLLPIVLVLLGPERLRSSSERTFLVAHFFLFCFVLVAMEWATPLSLWTLTRHFYFQSYIDEIIQTFSPHLSLLDWFIRYTWRLILADENRNVKNLNYVFLQCCSEMKSIIRKVLYMATTMGSTDYGATCQYYYRTSSTAPP